MFEWLALVELVRGAAGVDARGVSGGDLLAGLTAVVDARAHLDAVEAHLLAELDAQEITDRELGLSTAAWWSRQAGLPMSVARSRVQVARRLRNDLDEVDAALVAGDISWEHARVLDQVCNPRVADRVAAIQSELMELAGGALFESWKRDVRGIVELLDEHGGHDPAGDLARNHLSVVPTVDGVTHVSGALVGEHAEITLKAIDTMTDELFRRYTADHERAPDIEVPKRATLRALALAELCRRAQAVDIHATVAPRPDLSLVVQAEEPDRAVTRDGVRLADGSTRTLLCDPAITAVIVDRLGIPLDMGRKTRLATSAQRRALAIRDGGCAFPGCDAPIAWTDCHHVVPHHLGGGTDLANLVLVCRHHHGVTHRTGWTMHADGPTGFTWTTPSGQILHSQQHGRTRPTADEPP